MPSKKKFIWKEKFLSRGGGGKKKGPNFPTKFPIKVGKFYQWRGGPLQYFLCPFQRNCSTFLPILETNVHIF